MTPKYPTDRKLLESDSTELSTRSRNFEAMQSFRFRTSKYIRQSLGFASAEDKLSLGPPETNLLITSFGIVGEALMSSYTPGKDCNIYFTESRWQRLTAQQEQRGRLLEHIEFFLKMSTTEQHVALGDSLPSLEEYLRRRMGTSAVRVCLALTEWVFSVTKILALRFTKTKRLTRMQVLSWHGTAAHIYGKGRPGATLP